MHTRFTYQINWATSFGLGFLVAFSVLLLPRLTQAQAPTLDFETGDMRGWVVAGPAFDCQPARGDNPVVRQRGAPSGYQGNYWVTSLGCYPILSRADRLQGTATYGPFQIRPGKLSFLISGSSSFQTRAELLIHDEIEQQDTPVLRAPGQGTEIMQRVSWDVTPYAHRTGRIRIVDESSAPGGHINVDDFQFISREEPPPPELVTVPQLLGHILRDARAILEMSRLHLATVQPLNSDQPPDTIIDQKPAAGRKVPPFTGVSVVVAATRMVVVPPLVGRIFSEAQQIIAATPGLQLRVERQEPSDREPGTVLAQNPSAGMKVHTDSVVNVVVAMERKVEVPDLIGHSAQEAEQMIAARPGLTLEVRGERFSPQAPGTVLEQYPAPQTMVSAGAIVEVIVAKVEMVTVPDLVGHSLGESEQIVANATGLHLEVNHYSSSNQKPGVVLEQSPSAGESVPVGSAVSVIIARGLQLTSVLLRADPLRANAGDTVLFRAEARPEIPGAQYYFDFGDDSSSRMSAVAVVQHTYRRSGTYRAVVLVGVGDGRPVESNAVTIQIEWSAGPITIAGLIVGIAVLMGAGYYTTEPRRRRARLKRAGIGLAVVPSVGRQQMESPPSNNFVTDVRLSITKSEGQQTTEVVGSLVTGEEVLHE